MKEARDKRAYIAYLEYLLNLQKKNPGFILEDGTPISLEINRVESHLKDLSFMIEHHSNAETG